MKVDDKTGVLDFAGGSEWCLLELGVPGIVKKIEVDTNHFKGNFPDSITVLAKSSEAQKDFQVLLPPKKLGPHQIHCFEIENDENLKVSHVKVVIQPDGGISRLRIWGQPSCN